MKGWNSSKHPILTVNQMPAPIHWNPMNEDWKMRLTKSQIYNTSSGFDTQTLDAMKKLHDRQKVEELQHKMLVNQIREDMIAHPLNYVDRFAMTDSYETLCTNAKHHYIDCSYDGIKCFLYGKTGYSDAFNNGAWLFTHPDLVAEFNGEPLPEQESNPEFYKTDFWTKLASWIEANMKGTSVERRQRLYNSYISDRPIQHQLTEYGLIAPDGTWYACEFGEHAALAGRIIMRNRETFGLSDHEVLNMAYD